MNLFYIFKRRRRRKPSISSRKSYLANKEQARELVRERVEFFNQSYGFNYNKIFIKNTRSRWGSCSTKGNLNFNYRVVFLPTLLADYIIVHELCHLGEFNHSAKFWSLVARAVPNYRTLRAKLKLIRFKVK